MSTKKTDEERTLLFVKTFASFTPPAVRRSREKRRHPKVKTAPEKEVALTILVSREMLAKKKRCAGVFDRPMRKAFDYVCLGFV